MFRLLKEVLQRKVDQLQSSSQAEYDNPNWAYKQADKLGQLRSYQYVLNLIDLKEK